VLRDPDRGEGNQIARHLETTILPPQKFDSEGVCNFEIPLRAVSGKPIVVMVPAETERESGLLLTKEVAAKYQPDYGVVAKCVGCEGLYPGMLVAITPYSGAWYTSKEFDWIPEGRMVKILGTAKDWQEDIQFIVQN
jgi:hypothetical protein